jgi:COP9 signalosome complex subunit 1
MEHPMNVDVDSSADQIIRSTLPKISDPVVCSSLNLAAYIGRYSGYTRIQRLLFVADKCTNLQEEAYRHLLSELKRGTNTTSYINIHALVGAVLGYDLDVDREWIEMTENSELVKLERLEAELMAAKTTMVKESMRLSYNDIGDLHYQRGNLPETMKSYLRTRDYCTTPKHNLDMWVRLISVSIDSGQFGNVNFYITKAENAGGDGAGCAKIKAAGALVLLVEGQYKSAARKFLEVGWELGGTFSSIIAAEDIAVYGTLTALASLDRNEIRKKMLDNSVFKSFLELAPSMRKLVNDFFMGKYGDCLTYLKEIQSELLLDIHLSKHANTLISKITERIILQYFSPYSSVDMNRMAETLNMNISMLEKTVAALISNDKMLARIDSQSKTLHLRQDDVRTITLEKVERLSAKHLTEVKRGILRLSVTQHGLQVTGRENASGIRRGNQNNSSSNQSEISLSGGCFKVGAHKRTPNSTGPARKLADDATASGERAGARGLQMLSSPHHDAPQSSILAAASRSSDSMMIDTEGDGEDDNEVED